LYLPLIYDVAVWNDLCHLSLLFLGVFTKLWKGTISFVMSVCLHVRLSAWNSWAPTGQICIRFDLRVFFKSLSRKV